MKLRRICITRWASWRWREGGTTRPGNISETGRIQRKGQNPLLFGSVGVWLEAECGENERARQCFKRGLEVCPKSKYCWLAWGRFEASIGNIQRARELIQRGEVESRG